MARIVSTIALIVLFNAVAGCQRGDSGRGQIMPARTKTALGAAPVVQVAQATEVDIVEQVAVNRQAYRQGLELLVEYYTRSGNNMKLQWAKNELAKLNAIPQYKYIIEAEVAGPNLKASTSIPEADELYRDGLQLQRRAGPLPAFKNAELLRLALDKYNQLIKQHPTSDKIDDAAYQAGGIYEYFKDYSIAVLYYKRAYQWDAETIYPAKFKAAFILDKRLHRRAEALELYKQAVKEIKREGQHQEWKEFAEKRIRELLQSEEPGE